VHAHGLNAQMRKYAHAHAFAHAHTWCVQAGQAQKIYQPSVHGQAGTTQLCALRTRNRALAYVCRHPNAAKCACSPGARLNLCKHKDTNECACNPGATLSFVQAHAWRHTRLKVIFGASAVLPAHDA